MLSKKKFGEHKKSCQKFYIFFFFFFLFFVFFVVCLFVFFNKNWSQRVEAVHLDRHDCRLNFNPEALEKARANCGLRTRCVMELLPASASSPQPSPVVVAVANPFDAAVFVSATLSAPATTPAARTTSCSVVSHKKNTHTQQQSGTVVEVEWVVVSLRPFSRMVFKYITLKRFSALHLLFITPTTYFSLHRSWRASLSHWERSHSEGWNQQLVLVVC